jgi:DNA-directed RNA polymerase specialized sigma24 family protein
VDRAELARRGAVHVQAGQADTPHRGVLLAYSHALHRACSAADGVAAQNAGYTELHRYLFEVAVWRYPDVGEEAAQSALVYVYTSFGRCRQPGAFLAFALQHLLNAARTARRQGDRTSWPLTSAEESGQSSTADPDPAAAPIIAELRERLTHLTAAFLRRHPRAGRQLAALRMKYVDGLDEQAISQALGVPARTLYVLRSRAAAKLRAEPEWRALAVEFGIVASADEVQDSTRTQTFEQ